MSILAGMSIDEDIKEVDPTKTGPLEAGIYQGTITRAVLMQSKGGASGFSLEVTLENGRKYYGTEWFTSGKAKGQLPYFVRENGEKVFLPGYIATRNVAFIATGKDKLTDLTTEMRGYPQADGTIREMETLVELLGKPIAIGILQVRENKTVANDVGERTKTAEETFFNSLDGGAVFEPSTMRNYNEIVGDLPAQYHTKWAARNAGKVRDKYVAVTGTTTAPFGVGAPSTSAAPTSGNSTGSIL